jgi:hypothetical protein
MSAKQCPWCLFAFPPGDPRMLVSKRERCRVLACPGCRSAIRVWAEGAEPRPASALRSILVVAIAIAAIYIIWFR